jgi:hypothetical protein
MNTKVEVTNEEWKRIQRQLAKLNALEAGGVANWEWYDESLTNWFKENEIDELIDNAVIDIGELTAEAKVDQPAGPGCGYSIRIPEEDLRKLLLRFGDKYQAIALNMSEE